MSTDEDEAWLTWTDAVLTWASDRGGMHATLVSPAGDRIGSIRPLAREAGSSSWLNQQLHHRPFAVLGPGDDPRVRASLDSDGPIMFDAEVVRSATKILIHLTGGAGRPLAVYVDGERLWSIRRRTLQDRDGRALASIRRANWLTASRYRLAVIADETAWPSAKSEALRATALVYSIKCHITDLSVAPVG